MNKAFKYRLLPNSAQEDLIQKTFGSCRFIYNRMLEDKIDAYERTGVNITTTPAMYKTEFVWLKDVDSYALCNEQVHLQSAYNNFFRNPLKVGYPRFKSKKYDKKSYTTSNVNNTIRINDAHRIHLTKLGWVKFVEHRQIPSDYVIKSATISQSATGKYYISILTEYNVEENITSTLDPLKAVGLDYSSHDFYVDSAGNRANYPRFFRQYQNRLATEQRKLSHMNRDSSNYNKQRIKIAKIHEKIANSRKDFCHKLSTHLANSYDYVIIEDIDLRSTAQSLNLGKSTNDNGFGTFRTYLSYKLTDRGKRLVKIGKFTPSSTICSVCGAHHKDIVNSLSVRKWTCPDCNTEHDRDINAAKNIKHIGLTLT